MKIPFQNIWILLPALTGAVEWLHCGISGTKALQQDTSEIQLVKATPTRILLSFIVPSSACCISVSLYMPPSESVRPRRPAGLFHLHQSFMSPKTAPTYAGTESSPSSCRGDGFISPPSLALSDGLTYCVFPPPVCCDSTFTPPSLSSVIWSPEYSPPPTFFVFLSSSVWPKSLTDAVYAHPDHTGHTARHTHNIYADT